MTKHMSTTIKYIKGNLFDNIPSIGLTYIPHCCNNIGVMGSGFVVPLCQRWEKVLSEYKRWYKINSNTLFLGTCQYVQVELNVCVINMIAQDGVVSRDNPTPIKYKALIECMSRVRDDISHLTSARIIAPKFGSGLAGGSWDMIEELIDELWTSNNIPVTIFEL